MLRQESQLESCLQQRELLHCNDFQARRKHWTSDEYWYQMECGRTEGRARATVISGGETAREEMLHPPDAQ